jgi:hypothetical protein
MHKKKILEVVDQLSEGELEKVTKLLATDEEEE